MINAQEYFFAKRSNSFHGGELYDVSHEFSK